MNLFLSGGLFSFACVIALFLFRSWRDTKDRFFLLFSAAFAILAIERLPMILANAPKEWNFGVYVFRLLAYCLILVAIVDKNRSRDNDR